MKRVIRWPIAVLFAASLAAALSDYQAAKQKFDRIESDQLRAGSRIELNAGELTAWVEHELPDITGGVRDPRLELVAAGVARGTAVVDFAKVRASQGHPPGFLMQKLLEGEHPVSVTCRIRSAQGQATVDVQRVEIAGLEIEGRTLDFLVHNFLSPLYPNAVIGQPFELGHRIEKLDVQPRAVGVVIGR